jgi:phage-related protein (TIGR01555 family)
MYLFDTFTNFLSGLGMAGRDKMTAHVYTKQIWTRQQLEASFQSDWIARKAIVIPAQDSTRMWRSWQAEAEQIEKLEKTENRLQLQLKLQQALIKSRLYGGCCLLIGVDGNMEKELDPETIKADGLKFIHVLAPHQLSVERLVRDISSPYYGQPEFYFLRDEGQTKGKTPASEVKIHPSRMVRLIGLESPDPLANEGWGDPLMQMINDAVSAAGTVTQSVATLISEAKLDVIKIPGITEIFATAEGTNKLINRFAEANVAKSVINGIVMDSEEEWQRIGVDFTGMPEVLQMYLQIAAGACDIPVTRFLGMSPAGLNATGESDLANYYDKIKSDQELRLSPALEKLDKAIQRSALGKFDENIFYEWNSLWQMSATDKAALEKVKADTAAVDAATGLVPFEALVKGRVNQLIEAGTYPGLEAGIEEAIANMELPGEEAEEQKQLPPPDDYDENESGMDGALEGKTVRDAFNKEFEENLHPRLKGRFTFSTGGEPSARQQAAMATKALQSAQRRTRAKEELGPGYSKSAKINPRTGVIHTDNVNDAVLALYQDRHVELKQPKQVSTLIRTLGEATRAMVEGGEVPPNYDLCKVSVAGTNLFCAETKGIPRIKMPQMDDEQTKAFIKYLGKLGFDSEKDVEKSANLRATQNQLDTAKVNKFFERIKKDKQFKGDDKRLVISRDDYVLDGHHHWAAQIAADTIDNKLGDHKTKVYRVDIDIIPLYKLAMKFTGGKGAKGQGDSAGGVWITFGDGFHYTADELIDVLGMKAARAIWVDAMQPRKKAKAEHELVAYDTTPWLKDKNWDESKATRNEEGEFGTGAPDRKAQNEAALAALSGSQPKKVEVKPHPVAIDVGGDEWNKQTALRLELEYQMVRPKLEALLNADKRTPDQIELDKWKAEGSPLYAPSGEKVFPGDPNYNKLKEELAKSEAEDEAKYAAEDEEEEEEEEEKEYDGPPEPESWDMLSEDQQEEIKSEFQSKGYESYLESEQNNWYENGGALDEAKGEIAASTDFQHEHIKDWIEGEDDKGEKWTDTEFPFTALDLADSITIEYESDGEGSGKLKVEFDDAVLDSMTPIKGGAHPDQLTMPGIEPVKNSELLTKEMRAELKTVLRSRFDKEAEDKAPNMTPPEYLADSAKEFADEDWDHNYDDNSKYEWAKSHTNVIDEAQQAFDEAYAEFSGQPLNASSSKDDDEPISDVHGEPAPGKWDPLNKTSGTDYKKTQKIAAELSLKRAMQVFEERSIKLKPGVNAKAAIKRLDRDLWTAWKASSTSSEGQLLQVATADELGGRLNPVTGRGGSVKLDKDEQRLRAEKDYEGIGGYDAIKAYVRAKWETTQYLLDRAGMHELELYRGITLDDEPYKKANEESVREGEYVKAPTLHIVRNGAASTTSNPSVANGWSDGDQRIVLRALMPRTAALSIPAYGINVKSEQEVVVAGTAWKKWDAWVRRAPEFSKVKMAA